jgi:peptidoglycan/LPS O-acetylase OafA/YrhL
VGRYSATRQPYLTYLGSRVWRLLPTFVLINLGVLVSLYFRGVFPHYWNSTGHFHFVASNLLILGYQSLPVQPIVPAWSLDIEMQFYFIAPFLAILLAWRKVPAGGVLAATALVSLLAAFFHAPFPLLSYLIFFVVGMTAASVDWRPSGRLTLAAVGTVVLAIAFCLASPWRGVLLVGAHPGPLAVYAGEANVALALLLAPYAIYTTGQQGFRMDGMFGDLSYVVYLLHWPAVWWISRHAGGWMHKMLSSAEALVVVLLVALAIWRFYDHPINRMRSRWVSSRKRRLTVVETDGEPGREKIASA